MASLLDIAPATATVKVGDQDVALSGVSIKGVAYLLGKFEALRRIMAGQGADILSADLIMKLGPDVAAAVIACGCGLPDNAEAEAVAAALPAGVQFELLEKIYALTMPKGVRPFMDRLESLGLLGAADPSNTAPDTTSPQPSSN